MINEDEDDLEDLENNEDASNHEKSDVDSDEKEDREIQKNENLILGVGNENKLQSTFVELEEESDDKNSDEGDFLWNIAGRERGKEEKKLKKIVDNESEEEKLNKLGYEEDTEVIHLVGDINSLLSRDKNIFYEGDEGFDDGLPFTTILRKKNENLKLVVDNEKTNENLQKSQSNLKRLKKSVADISQINRIVCTFIRFSIIFRNLIVNILEIEVVMMIH
jgi:hypothetical protein